MAPAPHRDVDPRGLPEITDGRTGCEFLVGHFIDAATLASAADFARENAIPVHRALLTLGWVSDVDYADALGRRLDVAVGGESSLALATCVGLPAGIAVMMQGKPAVALDAQSQTPVAIAEAVSVLRRQGHCVVLATCSTASGLATRPASAARLDEAISGLARRFPRLSAAQPLAPWQKIGGGTAGLALAASLLYSAPDTVRMLLLVLTVPFICIAVLRIVALFGLVREAGRGDQGAMPFASRTRTTRQHDASLPVYSILVPLVDEADVLPRLVQSLVALDYPAAKLDIMLILEESDAATRAAVEACDLPGNIRTVIVPPGGPRTKPKALNYALNLARGDYVVVYDAEDRPEPRQLRDALAQFCGHGPDLACVQARLNTYNPSVCFLTRQFTLEYSVLFDAVLPALERLRLPLPLGGTSNHFRIEALRSAGAWDPYNVTEDADLGIRLARLGLRTATIASTTWEEAPSNLGNWRRQRTRWLKGWMQTYLVHMRQPGRLWAELGMRSFIGLQVLMGSILISVLAHPLIYVLIGVEAWNGRFLTTPQTLFEICLAAVACCNLALGIASSMLVGVVAVIRRGRGRLAWQVLLMPAYWLLISAAGYRALIQLCRQPYLWEKTRHGGPNA